MIKEKMLRAMQENLTTNMQAEKCQELCYEEMIQFAEWLRLNYQNSALEFDNYWEEVVPGEFHSELGKAYTTKELLQIYLKERENGK